MPDSSITRQVSPLKFGKAELRKQWQELFERDSPVKMRRELMVRVIAYRLQEQEFGGLSEAICRRLRQLADVLEANPKATLSTRSPIKPGTRLVREWKQQVHVVEADTKGYQYKGARYESLSEIARIITGTRWSGPLFFGLRPTTQKIHVRGNES